MKCAIRIEAWRQDYNAFRRMKPLKTRRPRSSSAGSLISNFRLYPRHKRWALVNGSAYISECAKDAPLHFKSAPSLTRSAPRLRVLFLMNGPRVVRADGRPWAPRSKHTKPGDVSSGFLFSEDQMTYLSPLERQQATAKIGNFAVTLDK